MDDKALDHVLKTRAHNKEIVIWGSDAITQWNGFKKWLENTRLFTAIKEGTHKVNAMDFYHITTPDGFSLKLNKGHLVNTMEDLPIEMIAEFFKNSPWFNQRNTIITKYITNEH